MRQLIYWCRYSSVRCLAWALMLCTELKETKMIQNKFLYVLLIAACLALSACATTAKNAEQLVYATSGMYVVVSHTACDAYEAGTINQTTFSRIDDQLNNVRPKIDDAVSIVRSGKPLPQSKLEIIEAIQKELLEIQKRLEADQ